VLDGVVEIPLSGKPVGSRPLPGAPSGPALEAFLLGPENGLVELAVRSLLVGADDAYSPIVLCGASGTGKSHLAWGLAAVWTARSQKRAAVYVPAVDFARQLTEAMQTKTVDDFRLRYRHVRLLAVDDLEHLAGKPAAQRELLFTLDALEAAGSHALVTAKRPPAELLGLMAGLQSRLSQGLVVPLALPGRAARLAILECLARARGVEFAQGALPMLADGLKGTFPELNSAIAQLEFGAAGTGRLIGPERVGEHLAQYNGSRRASLRQIASITARSFSLRLSDLRGPSRRRPTPTARALAMYLARNLTTDSLKQIGQYFGGRDHTTVSYSCRKTEERLRREPELQDALFSIQEELQQT
jgi:chromosomal replication initiator protein